MRLPRPCIDCGLTTEAGKTRCRGCSRIVRRNWDRGSALRRQARLKEGDGAARRLRAAINRHGSAVCGACLVEFSALFIRVDHSLPLAAGGQDIEENIQPLCKNCHQIKTTAEQSRHSP